MVPGIILDGSNLSLHNARTGRLESLDNLSFVINCLVKHGYEPYTVFDASFRYKLREGSEGRLLFERLTKRVPEHFQMSPRGEEADLFILELAVSTGFPVLSNDTFSRYGKLKGNILSYGGNAVELNNFKIMAGTILILDRGIRYKIEDADRKAPADSDEELTASIASHLVQEAASSAAPITESSRAPAKHGTDSAPLAESSRDAVLGVISQYLKDGGGKYLSELGRRLSEHRARYMQESGNNKGRRIWFGFPTLKEFFSKNIAGFIIEGDRIVPEDEGSDGEPR